MSAYFMSKQTSPRVRAAALNVTDQACWDKFQNFPEKNEILFKFFEQVIIKSSFQTFMIFLHEEKYDTGCNWHNSYPYIRNSLLCTIGKKMLLCECKVRCLSKARATISEDFNQSQKSDYYLTIIYTQK